MPAITDPVLLAQIKQQQLPQVTPQPFPGARVLGPMQKTQTPADAQLATQRGLNIEKTQDEIAGKDEISDDTADFYAHDVLAGAQMPTVGMGATAAKNRQKIMEATTRIAKTMGLGGEGLAVQQAHYKAASGALKTLETQRDVTGQNETTAMLNGQQYMDRSAELPMQGGGPALNNAVQFLQKHLPFVPGHDTKAAMDSAWGTFTTEYAKVVAGSPTGSGILSDSARHEQMEIMQNSLDPSQKIAAFHQMQADMNNRMTAMNKAVKQGYVDLVKHPDLVGTEDQQLSTTSKTVPIPQGYQDDHLAYLHQHPPGHLTVQGYIDMRKQLDDRYANDIGSGHSEITPEDAEKFVKQYNESNGQVQKIPGMQMPLSEMEHLHAAAAESGPGVMAASAANAASMGIGENLLTDEQKHLMHMSEDAHPAYSLAGEVAGSVAGMAGIEKLGIKGLEKLTPEALDKLGVKLVTNDAGKTVVVASAKKKLAGDIAVNSSYGAGRGFNDADQGQGLTGAAEGAGAGAVGAGVGNIVAKGVNPLISEGTSKALSQLKGVKTTTLQRLGLGSSEEAFSGVPGAHGARAESISSFNRDNASRALGYMKSPLLAGVDKTIPKSVATGTEMNSVVNDSLSKGYNIIRPQIVGAVDGTFVKNMKTLVAAGTVTPAKKAMFQEIKDAVQQFADPVTGHYNGDGYKAASERLRALTQDFSTAAENNGDVGARDMARIAEQARKQLQMLIQRQTPEVGVALKQLERGWAHKMRIEDASNRALQNNETGYSPGQYLTSVKKLDTSGNKTAYARGKAFDQPYGEAAGKIIGFGPAKKISPKEILYASTLMGIGGYEAPVSIPIVTGMAAGLYGPGIKRIVQKALTGQRPSSIDNQIVRRALADATRHKMTGN